MKKMDKAFLHQRTIKIIEKITDNENNKNFKNNNRHLERSLSFNADPLI